KYAPGESGIVIRLAGGQRPGPAGSHGNQVAAEVQQHGEQAAEVQSDVERQTLVRPTGEGRYQDQVRRAGNREKFSEALEQGKDNNVQPIHDGYALLMKVGVSGARK